MTDSKPLTRRERRLQLRAKTETIATPALRRWAYGVTAAAAAVAVFAGWLPAPSLAVVLPLLMAVFYVDEKGEPRG